MCHLAHVRVTLSAEDKKDIKKLAGVMVPVYASILLAMVAAVAVAGAARQGELVASAAALAATR